MTVGAHLTHLADGLQDFSWTVDYREKAVIETFKVPR